MRRVYKIYDYSSITKSKAIIYVPWIESQKDPWYSFNSGYHSGIDIKANKVYSASTGVVIHIGYTPKEKYTVIVQYDETQCVSYSQLSEANVVNGQILNKEDLIGQVDEFVHFEYATLNKGLSMWSVWAGFMTYYKQNPEGILSGSISIDKKDTVTEYRVNPGVQITF